MLMEETGLLLPPGFRFHPTDEEIIAHYLTPKILDHGFVAQAMGVVNLNKCEPWDLPGKAKMGEKEWYFFCQKDRKYPTGMRTNRATVSGYWKATGKDKEIFRGRGVLVGMRKTLVFYSGRAPKGEKTSWVMHEFRIQGRAPSLSTLHKSAKDEWTVCRVFHKNSTGARRSSTPPNAQSLPRLNNLSNDLPESFALPPLMDPPCFNSAGGSAESYDIKEFMMGSTPFPNPYLCTSFINDNPPEKQNLTSSMSKEIMGYLDEQEEQFMMMRSSPPPHAKWHCKAEQFSNPSMLSQDTGLSTDRYTEISSAMIKPDFDIDDFDLCSMWR